MVSSLSMKLKQHTFPALQTIHNYRNITYFFQLGGSKPTHLPQVNWKIPFNSH